MSCNNSREINRFVAKKRYSLENDFTSLNSIDSIAIEKSYNGNVEEYKKYIVRRRLMIVDGFDWHDAGKYILLDAQNAKRVGHKMGFDAPYFFIEYLKSEETKGSLKKKFSNLLKAEALKQGIIRENEHVDLNTLMLRNYKFINKNGCGNGCKCKLN